MLDCVLRYEAIDIVAGRLMSYAGLRYYQQTTDADRAKFIADMQEKITSYTTPLVFFSLEINRIEDDKLDALFAGNADLARYRAGDSPACGRCGPTSFPTSWRSSSTTSDRRGGGLEPALRRNDGGDGPSRSTARRWPLESTLNLLTDHDRAKREAAAKELAKEFGARSSSSPACTTR